MVQTILLRSTKNKNALSTSVLEDLQKQLLEAASNPSVKAIFLSSESDDFFCAGGDVKELYQSIQSNRFDLCNEFFTTEYSTDYLVHIFKKPIVVWVDGIVFGGGLGLIQGASHKIFSPSALAAMPEVLIGLFPDVGASYFLQGLPREWREAIALRARRINAIEAFQLGLCDYLIKEKKQKVHDKISSLDLSKNASAVISEALNELSEKPKKISYKMTTDEKDNSLYACPSSLAFVRKQMEAGKAMTLRQAFETEWQYAYHFCRGANFKEGVRALLVDKDKRPAWKDENIVRYFSKVNEKSFEEFKKLLDTLEAYEYSF